MTCQLAWQCFVTRHSRQLFRGACSAHLGMLVKMMLRVLPASTMIVSRPGTTLYGARKNSCEKQQKIPGELAMFSLRGSEWHAICCFLTPVSKGFELALSDGAPAPWPKPASVAVYQRLVNSANSGSSLVNSPNSGCSLAQLRFNSGSWSS